MRIGAAIPAHTPFDLKFTSCEVSAWDSLWPSCKRMLDGIGLQEALQKSRNLPQPGLTSPDISRNFRSQP